MKKILFWICIIFMGFLIIRMSLPLVAGIYGAMDKEQDEECLK